MLILFVGLVLCNICAGDYAVTCGERDGLSLEETRDGVEGRYRLEWCTQQYYPVANWYWTLYAGDDGHPDNCYEKYFDRHQFHKHSYNMEPINIELNCTQSVCLSTTLDLIFNGTCYKVQTYLRRTMPNSTNTPSCCNRSFVQYVYNNYTKEYFTKSEARVNVYPSGQPTILHPSGLSHNNSWNPALQYLIKYSNKYSKASPDHVTVDWFLGHIPSNMYIMDMCSGNKTIGEMCTQVTQCRTANARRTQIQCALRPPHGPYLLRLRHAAPWCSGTTLFEDLVYSEHRSSVQPASAEVPSLAVGGGAAWRWAAPAAISALALITLLWVLARRRTLRKPVHTIWKERRLEASAVSDGETKVPVAGEMERVQVLLLYARDCAPLMEVAQALTALLTAAGFHVLDVYSAEVMAAAARAGGEWVRGVVARPSVRVLLLQTPAARCLHHARLAPSAATGMLLLERPLLNRVVSYARPHAGDALFLLALRLLAAAALTSQDYRKYYLATIESLEVELLAEVTPLQRYSLPGAAALLVRDLAAPSPCPAPPPAPPPADALRQLAASVARLHAFVRDKPDYLDDELIFFDLDT